MPGRWSVNVVNGSQSAPAFSHSVKDQHHPVPAVESTPSHVAARLDAADDRHVVEPVDSEQRTRSDPARQKNPKHTGRKGLEKYRTIPQATTPRTASSLEHLHSTT
jgi:hypothetical protein